MRNIQQFIDRRDAGERLAEKTAFLAGQRVAILALPRGGVPVAREVAETLGAPLDIIAVRKLGVPGHREFGFGALSERGAMHVDWETVRRLRLTRKDIVGVTSAEAEELARRIRRYRGNRPLPNLKGQIALIVDDGIATGGTVRAAIESVRGLDPAGIIVATPVAPRDTVLALSRDVDQVITVFTPRAMGSIGAFYQSFPQVSDEEVVGILREMGRRPPPAPDLSGHP